MKQIQLNVIKFEERAQKGQGTQAITVSSDASAAILASSWRTRALGKVAPT